MEKVLHFFERTVVLALLIIMGIIILISTGEIVILLFQYLKDYSAEDGQLLLLSSGELLKAFSFVMLILIGVELFETIKFYLDKHVFQAEVILLVALTAISRKIIILDFEKYDGITIIGIALIIVALTVGYYYIKRAHRIEKELQDHKDK